MLHSERIDGGASERREFPAGPPCRLRCISMTPSTAVLDGPRLRSSAPTRRSVDLSTGPLVDADHVAAVLCVKRKRVYELARRHRDPLPCVRIGGAVRFVLAQVEEWVAAQSPR